MTAGVKPPRTCLHCLADITQDEDGKWVDGRVRPEVCMKALSYEHRPLAQPGDVVEDPYKNFFEVLKVEVEEGEWPRLDVQSVITKEVYESIHHRAMWVVPGVRAR